jgi:hypothetical protein
MKEKYEHEIRELENSEKGLKDKYIDARTRLAESEANSQNLKAMVTQMELQLNHVTKVSAGGGERNAFQEFDCVNLIVSLFSSARNSRRRRMA